MPRSAHRPQLKIICDLMSGERRDGIEIEVCQPNPPTSFYMWHKKLVSPQLFNSPFEFFQLG